MQEPFLEFSADEFVMLPFNTKPIDGFEFPVHENGNKFPLCCKYHQSIYENAIDWFDKFPNCCDKHLKMSKQKNFFINNYQNVPMKIVTQLAYTEFHIKERINNSDWYEDITDYIDCNLKSFGHPQVGIEKYFGSIKRYIKDQRKIISSDKQKLLLEYLELQLSPIKGKREAVSINALHAIYQKWIKAFPFELSFFQPLKKQFANKLPIIDGVVKHNRYLDLANGKALTSSKLIETLIVTTKALLNKVDTTDLLQKGIISNTTKHQIDLANQAHRIKQSSLLDNYSKTEIRYVTILKSWLSNEKSYFQEILPLITKKGDDIEPLELNKIDKLATALKKYQFELLPRVANLNETNRQNLIEKIAISELPYQIAMLEYLGFVDQLKKRNFKTNVKLFKGLANILPANERSVKGNIYVLNPNSTEDRSRYTAHFHTDKVMKDYDNLK